MIPIVLDPERVSLALIGRGPALLRRLDHMKAAGARRLSVFSDDKDPALSDAAGERLRPYLPAAGDLSGFQAVWIVGIPKDEAAALAETAQTVGALVNVEDEPSVCDFHNVAQVRRGDLLLTVSTGGKSPGLAARIRRMLETQFGPEWAERLDALGARRAHWRRERRSYDGLVKLTNATVDREGWLP
jgi:precorrin-2 dehydrogenase/sirohydrochlorin ferrochelatase